MATTDRRNFMSLDSAYSYCRLLELKAERPTLYKILNALKTVDAALKSAVCEGNKWAPALSVDAWSQVRDTLYNILLTSFAGYFLIYKQGDINPLESQADWPNEGIVEFFPDLGRRREDGCLANLAHLDPRIHTVLRWCFAEGRQNIQPADFSVEPLADEESEATSLMDRLYETCIEEATRCKKRAHEKWWQLYWQANSCNNKKEKHELNKMMAQLQSVWGRPN